MGKIITMNGEVAGTMYRLDELTAEEHLALNYCLARLEPLRFAQPFVVVWQVHVKHAGEGKARQNRNTGLEGLMGKGILEGAVRDGHRDWDVVGDKTVLRLDLLVDNKRLFSPGIGRAGPLVGEGE